MAENPLEPLESGDDLQARAGRTRPPAQEVPVLDVEFLPEVVSDLASTSELHDHQLAELAGVVSELGGSVATVRDETQSLREFLLELQESLVERVNLRRPNRWAWGFLARDEAAQLWSELRWFVDYLIARYPLSSDMRIPPCWYCHTVAVDELTALYAAWRHAYCSGDQPSDEMIAWRNRWLWPTLQNLHAHADWRECKAQRQHVAPAARQELTDDSFHDFVTHDLDERTDERSTPLPWSTDR
ncbi:hypothetical protein AB0E59_47040 [Lentzea sp. NPDC034063]|uniref:hypothetical protein n=1 Tax=unclassified Lentzea TaxID=2643253 RepID=UPI00340DB6B8